MTIGILIALGVGVAIASQVAILGRASRTIHPLAISLHSSSMESWWGSTGSPGPGHGRR